MKFLPNLSPLFFFIPLISAYIWGVTFYVYLLPALILFAILNRASKKGNLRMLNQLLLWILIASNVYFVAIGNIISLPAALIVALIIPAAFSIIYIRKNPYIILSWHFFLALITLLSQLTFIS